MPIFAKGTGVRLPGYVMDTLAADLRNGVEAWFEVTFNKQSGDNQQDVMVASCGAMRVGDIAAECNQRHTCPGSRDRTTASSPLKISSAPVITGR
jgi:hypothetical protein